MKRLVFALFLSIAAVSAHAQLPPLETVPYVDVNRYMGTWYEIATIPQPFQARCEGAVTAQYRLMEDGSVNVYNACQTRRGTIYASEGRGFVANPGYNSKLEVSFVSAGGRWLFRGPYWILELGENYDYAVIGDPTRSYGWILSRTCSLPPETLNGIFSRLTAKGYDVNKFELTDQGAFGCP
jgi:apolipoprotein D and lipocalin family protein